MEIQRVRELEQAGHAVFFVEGGNIVEASAYRGRYSTQTWQAALRGIGITGDLLEEAAHASTTAYACITYRSETLAGLPLMVTDNADNEAKYHPLLYTLGSLSAVLWHVDAALNIWSKAYVLKRHNEAGYPTGLQWIHPSLIEPFKTATEKRWRVRDREGNEVTVPERNVIEIALHGVSAHRSPLSVALKSISGEQGVAQFRASFFLNSARPDGILISKSKMKSEDLEKAKEDWQQFKGSENAFKTFVSSGEWEWIPVTPSPVDLAMTETSGVVAADICKILQVNPVLIGSVPAADPLSAQSTYRQIERSHLDSVALPRLQRILNTLNEQWLWTDFREQHAYTLAVARHKIALLSDVNADNVAAASGIATSHIGDYADARRLLGLAENEDYFSRAVTEVLAAWGDKPTSILLLDEARRMVGLPDLGFGMGNIIRVGADLVPLHRLNEYIEARLKPQQSGFPFALSDVRDLVERVMSDGLAAIRAEMQVVRVVPPPVPIPEPVPVPQLPSVVIRNTGTLTVAASFAGNAFVRYARRVLADVLVQRNVLETTWLDEQRYTLPMLTLPNATQEMAQQAHAVLSGLELHRQDVTMQGYVVRDGTVYARVLSSWDAAPTVLDSVRAAGLEMTLDAAPGILLCYADLPDGDIDAGQSYPLVIATLAITYHDAVAATLTLRAYTPEQVKELENWRFVVMRKGAAARFTPEHLRGHKVTGFVRWSLRLGAAPEQIFDLAKRYLRGEFAPEPDDAPPVRADVGATPEEYERYWMQYEALLEEVGEEWLGSYMSRAWNAIRERVGEKTKAADIMDILTDYRKELADEWTGTRDKPGVITKLVLAGMAAGNEAVINNAPADYRAALRALDLSANWQLMTQEAHDFALEYVYDLIRRIDEETRDTVAETIAAWLDSGGTLDDLTASLYTVFHSETRARAIAQTESTRVYNEGAEKRWSNLGVKSDAWETVRDEHVCNICQPLHGTVTTLGTGFEHPGGDGDSSAYRGKRYKAPAHTHCRCFYRPVVDDLTFEVAA